MHQIEQLKLFFYDEGAAVAPDDPNDIAVRVVLSTPLYFRASLVALADYSSSQSLLRVARCTNQPDREFRIVLPLEQVRSLDRHGRPVPAASATQQLSARPAYGEVDCGRSVAAFALLHYCSNLTISLNPVDPQHSQLSDPMPFFDPLRKGNCIERADTFTRAYYRRTGNIETFDPWQSLCPRGSGSSCLDWALGIAVSVYDDESIA